MSGIATQAGMLRGGAGSDNALATDLVEWWEDADTTGKVSSGTLNLVNSNVSTGIVVETGGPNGLDWWNTSALNSAFQAKTNLSSAISGDFAAIACLKVRGYTYSATLSPKTSDGQNIGWRYVPYGGANKHELRTSTGFVRGTSDLVTFNDWSAIAVSYDYASSTSTFHLFNSSDSVLVSKSHTDTGGTILPFVFRQNADIAICAYYNRQLSAADVEAFYNSGNFYKYSDL
jgi:hypothetical protein